MALQGLPGGHDPGRDRVEWLSSNIVKPNRLPEARHAPHISEQRLRLLWTTVLDVGIPLHVSRLDSLRPPRPPN